MDYTDFKPTAAEAKLTDRPPDEPPKDREIEKMFAILAEHAGSLTEDERQAISNGEVIQRSAAPRRRIYALCATKSS